MTLEEHSLIIAIAERAHKAYEAAGAPRDQKDIEMDLVCCHTYNISLDLTTLLDSDEFTFAHDIVGIAKHMNRDTGKIEHCFLPRTARTQGAA